MLSQLNAVRLGLAAIREGAELEDREERLAARRSLSERLVPSAAAAR